MRLVDEIVSNSAYLDFGLESQIEYVAVSYDALNVIKKELAEELNKDLVSVDDIDKSLAMRHVIMPSMIGVDYRFFREIKFL